MTNSCVSSKWLPHIQTGNYGMSQNCIDESKEYIFVKLTDSAYRAVEEYQKNETKCSARAKIQVIGNGGVISFPTADDSEGQKFGFAIDDIEGSFECIKQTQNELDVLGTLPYKMRIQANDDVYEKTRHRMAVAEETQKNKCTREIKPNQTDIGRKVKLKNSIGSSSGGGGGGRESGSNGNISNSGSGNGSRNGISGGINNMNGSSSSVLPKRDSTSSNCSPIASIVNNNSSSNSINSHPLKTSSNSRSPNPSMSSSRSSNNNNNSQNNSNLVGMPTSASSLSSALSSAAGSGTSGISNCYLRGNSPEMKTNNSNKNGPHMANNRTKGKALGSGNGPGMGMNSNNNRSSKSNDITKRNIRERLIHLLALKPFKKPELYTRLNNEGIRDREKSLITNILKEISTMRDNTYNLKRPIWNDVNENWQFYTEQEVQMLKRRKPQNLTPPISSDAGSSTSGQSPTSTHNGSPPPAVKRPPSLDHRDRCYDDPREKKQRISHFKKDTITSSISVSASMLGPSSGNEKNQNLVNNQNHIDTDDNSVDLSFSVLDNDDFMIGGGVEGRGGGGGGMANSRRSGVSSGSTTASAGLKMYHNNNNKSPYSEAPAMTKHSSPYNSTSGGGNSRQQLTASPSTLSSNNNNNNKQSVIYSPSQHHQQPQTTTTTPATNHHSGTYGNKSQQQQSQYQQQHHHQQQQSLHYKQQQPPPPPQQQLPKQQHHHLQRHTQQQPQPQPQSQPQQQQRQQAQPQQQQSQPQLHTALHQQQLQQPQSQSSYDFSKYTKITTIEQRRSYKTEFENDYAEYRKLLSQIENVGKRFQVLADRLHSARNDADYSNIKKQIVNEYERIRNEKAHQRDKQRFDYLHEKLAHIKGLVSDYDKMLTAQASTQQSSDAAVTAPTQQSHLTNGTEPSSGYFPRSKLYHMTPSPTLDGSGGGGSGVLENGPAIHHQQSHHMMANDDDAY